MEPLMTGMLGGTFGLGFVAIWLIGKSLDHIERVEEKINVLLDHAGFEMSELAQQKARKHLQKGNKIAAIKVYRQLTNASLAEAKAAVERMEQRD